VGNDRKFLTLAYWKATSSPDPSNQNGAVLVIDGKAVYSDCNRFPTNFAWDESYLTDRDKKIKHIGHAESNTILGAGRLGIATVGATLYCPWAACREQCAIPIIMSGIRELVVHAERQDTTPERWKASVADALKYIADCGVIVRAYRGPIDGPTIKVNGEDWRP
jgi:deoxycytidylate deaminase